MLVRKISIFSEITNEHTFDEILNEIRIWNTVFDVVFGTSNVNFDIWNRLFNVIFDVFKIVLCDCVILLQRGQLDVYLARFRLVFYEISLIEDDDRLVDFVFTAFVNPIL